ASNRPLQQRAGRGAGHVRQYRRRLLAEGAVFQFDAQQAIGENGVAEDAIPGAGFDVNAVAGVEGNGVAGPGRRAADRVVAPGLDAHAVVAVVQVAGAVGRRADEVSLDEVARRVRIADGDSGLSVAGDHVAGTGGLAADGGVHRTNEPDAPR